MSIEEAILEKVRTLPPEKQSELLDFAEFLQARLPTPKRPKRSLRGLWSKFGINISEEEIAELRREMWKNFPREDIA
jgi:hypothetical protein